MSVVIPFDSNLPSYSSWDSHLTLNQQLYYKGLPLGFSPEEIIELLLKKDFSFISNSHGHFNLVLAFEYNGNRNIIICQDRFGSSRIFCHMSDEQITITNDWQFPYIESGLEDEMQYDHVGLEQCLATRLLSTERTLFELPSKWQMLSFDCAVEFGPDGIRNTIKTLEAFEWEETTENLSSQQKIKKIENNLNHTFSTLSETTNSCAVLLSGGVDSFILAAIAHKHFTNLVAYAPRFTQSKGHFAELDRARKMAAHLNIELVEVPIEDEKVVYEDFNFFLNKTGIPLRNFSSLALKQVMEKINEKHIVYGLYADVMFGYKGTKDQLVNANYLNIFSNFIKICKHPKLENFLKGLYKDCSPLGLLRLNLKAEEFSKELLSRFPTNQSKEDCMTNYMFEDKTFKQRFILSKGVNFRFDCRYHMIEIEAIASEYDKCVISPFFTKELNEISNACFDYELFGPQGTSFLKNFKRIRYDQLKPLLKSLACNYIYREIIFEKKLDFQVPVITWLDSLIESGAKSNRISKNELLDMPYEQQWTLISLQILEELIAKSNKYFPH